MISFHRLSFDSPSTFLILLYCFCLFFILFLNSKCSCARVLVLDIGIALFVITYIPSSLHCSLFWKRLEKLLNLHFTLIIVFSPFVSFVHIHSSVTYKSVLLKIVCYTMFNPWSRCLCERYCNAGYTHDGRTNSFVCTYADVSWVWLDWIVPLNNSKFNSIANYYYLICFWNASCFVCFFSLLFGFVLLDNFCSNEINLFKRIAVGNNWLFVCIWFNDVVDWIQICLFILLADGGFCFYFDILLLVYVAADLWSYCWILQIMVWRFLLLMFLILTVKIFAVAEISKKKFLQFFIHFFCLNFIFLFFFFFLFFLKWRPKREYIVDDCSCFFGHKRTTFYRNLFALIYTFCL